MTANQWAALLFGAALVGLCLLVYGLTTKDQRRIPREPRYRGYHRDRRRR